MTNWAIALDNLAASGVIDYDAPAFLLDKKPRYLGNPQMEQLPYILPVLLPENVKLKDLANIDEYEKQNNGQNIIKPKQWKKWLFGGLITGLIIAGTFKFGKLAPVITKIKNTKFIQKTVDIGNKVFDFLKNKYKTVIAKFNKP